VGQGYPYKEIYEIYTPFINVFLLGYGVKASGGNYSDRFPIHKLVDSGANGDGKPVRDHCHCGCC